LAESTVDIFNRLVADAPAAADALWRVGPTVPSDDAATLAHQYAEDNNVYFINRDDPVYVQLRGEDTPSLVNVAAKRVIYVRITNSVGTPGTFSLVLGADTNE